MRYDRLQPTIVDGTAVHVHVGSPTTSQAHTLYTLLLASTLVERALDVAWYVHVAACICAVLLGGDTQRGASWQLALMII